MYQLTRNTKLIAITVSALLLSACGTTGTSYKNQMKTTELMQTGIYYYWHGGDLKQAEKEFFRGITLKGKYDVVENAFAEASKLNPSRADLKFAIASTQILQKNTDGALKTYRTILKDYPDSFEAGILLAGYSKQIGDTATFEKTVTQLSKYHPTKTKAYMAKFKTTDELMNVKIATKAFPVRSDKHAIVVLGYALGDNGQMQPTLVERLKQTLAMHKANPRSPIIVSGGVQKAGVTEAFLMKNWLVQKGVPSHLIYPEDLAKDTVGNAINSAAILKNIKPKHITLISSASHIRRGLVTLQEAITAEGINAQLSNLAYLDYPSLKEAHNVPETEKLVIYRDFLRTAGIWAYPGIQR